jgi:hypothetical protein
MQPREAEISELLNNLERFRKDLERCRDEYDSITFFSLMRALISYLGEIEDPAVIELLRQSAHFGDYRDFFTSRQAAYYRAVELSEALSLRKKIRSGYRSVVEIFDREFSRNAYARIEDVFNFIDFSQCGTFVMVGCGPLPATLFCIHENTDLQTIRGLDNDKVATDSATELIAHLRLPRIRIEKRDGTDFDYQKTDVIYIANLASPKKKILDRIRETAKKDVQIVLRDPCRLGILLSERGMEDLAPHFHCIGEGIENKYFLSKHFFLTG